MKIAYVETEYHGGTGFQFATTWASGRIVQEPSLIESEFGVGAINEALSQFGVQPMPERDLFDTVGLTWYRDMDEFENPESEYYHTDYLDRRDKEHGW